MSRHYYIDLARRGAAVPIGADLVLKQLPDHERALVDGSRLGPILEATAHRFRTPLAFPLMDLQLEKAALLELLGIPAASVGTFHFTNPPAASDIRTVGEALRTGRLTPRMQANNEAIHYIATHTSLVPVGMCIGPFSLMTKLIADPITPVFLAGAGEAAEDSDEVRLVEACLELAVTVILESLRHQIAAGARAVFIAEPAANRIYFSPNQLAGGSDVFDRYVLSCNWRIAELLEKHHVDLLFHCCGELTDQMLLKFTELAPAVLSLGSSRNLVEDARIVPKNIVLFGNLPSKRFYSDKLITPEQLKESALRLQADMRATGHPFILGTECDTLSVPGSEKQIWSKVDAIVDCVRASAA